MTPLTGPDESGHDSQRNAGLTAAERRRLERHRVQCPLAVVHLSCDTCILLDTLDATEKERDELRRVIEAVREYAPSVPGLESVLRPLLPQPDAPAATADPRECSATDCVCHEGVGHIPSHMPIAHRTVAERERDRQDAAAWRAATATIADDIRAAVEQVRNTPYQPNTYWQAGIGDYTGEPAGYIRSPYKETP